MFHIWRVHISYELCVAKKNGKAWDTIFPDNAFQWELYTLRILWLSHLFPPFIDGFIHNIFKGKKGKEKPRKKNRNKNDKKCI